MTQLLGMKTAIANKKRAAMRVSNMRLSNPPGMSVSARRACGFRDANRRPCLGRPSLWVTTLRHAELDSATRS